MLPHFSGKSHLETITNFPHYIRTFLVLHVFCLFKSVFLSIQVTPDAQIESHLPKARKESMENRKDEQTTPREYHMEVLHLEQGLQNNQTSPLNWVLIVLKIEINCHVAICFL